VCASGTADTPAKLFGEVVCLLTWVAAHDMLYPALITGFTAVHRLGHVVGLAPMDFTILAAEKHNEEQKCSEQVVSYRIHMDSHV
jgi:hypothetical protein